MIKFWLFKKFDFYMHDMSQLEKIYNDRNNKNTTKKYNAESKDQMTSSLVAF